MNIYHAEMMRLAKSGIGAGELANAQTARVVNPLCGDECVVAVRLDGQRIEVFRHQTRGCILTQAAAATLAQLAQTTPEMTAMQRLTDDFNAMLNGTLPPPPVLAVFTPVIERKSRHACVLLPFRALGRVIGGGSVLL